MVIIWSFSGILYTPDLYVVMEYRNSMKTPQLEISQCGINRNTPLYGVGFEERKLHYIEKGKPPCSLLRKGNRCNLAWSPLTRFYKSAGAARVNQHAKTSFSLSLAGVVSILVDRICHFYEFPCKADKKYRLFLKLLIWHKQ